MAHFRGTVQGSRGEASRLGGKESGLTTTCNGWDLGVTCDARHTDGKDRIRITITSGSGSGNVLGTMDVHRLYDEGQLVVNLDPSLLLALEV